MFSKFHYNYLNICDYNVWVKYFRMPGILALCCQTMSYIKPFMYMAPSVCNILATCTLINIVPFGVPKLWCECWVSFLYKKKMAGAPILLRFGIHIHLLLAIHLYLLLSSHTWGLFNQQRCDKTVMVLGNRYVYRNRPPPHTHTH